MAMIKCPECGKEISDKAPACIHCGYPIETSLPQNTTSNNLPQKKTFIINKKIIYIGIAVLLLIVFLFPTIEKNTTNNAHTSLDMVQWSKANLKPYFDILGAKTNNKNLTVSKEFLDNLSSLELMGYLGTIEHGYSDPKSDFVDIMDWVSNTEISGKDYEHFIESLNQYFGSDASLKSYDNLSNETYQWVDYDELCMAYCWNKNGTVYVRWYLEEELVSSLTKSTSPKTTSSFSTPKTTNSSEVCVECGKSATYTYKNPFSGKIEDYCYTHYKEIKDIMSMMEEDVGSSKQSKHTCEQCSREGTHRYNSFTGQTEYYCTTHYEELMDMLESFGLD